MKNLKKISERIERFKSGDLSWQDTIDLKNLEWLVLQLDMTSKRIERIENEWTPIKNEEGLNSELFTDNLEEMKIIEQFFKKKFQTYKIPIEDLKDIWLKQQGKCGLCGDDLLFGKDTHLDHKVAKAKGGLDVKSNVHFTCSYCNYAKRDLDFKDFVAMCLKIADYHQDKLKGYEKAKVFANRWKFETRQSLINQRKDVKLRKKGLIR